MTEPETSDSTLERANTFPWAPLLFAAAIASSLLLSRFLPLPWPGLGDATADGIGLAFGIAGVLLIVSAMRALLKSGTALRPDGAATALVTSGPFSWFRNPIYLGEVLLLLWGAQATKSVWFVVLALVFAVLVTALQIMPEEAHLEKRFGDAYLAYKSRTRRWI